MSMQATLPTLSRGNPGKFKNNMLAQRKRRNDFAEMCFASLKDVHAFWVSVLQDTNRPFHERMQAADCLVRRAVGEVAKAPLEEGEAAVTRTTRFNGCRLIRTIIPLRSSRVKACNEDNALIARRPNQVEITDFA